MKLAAILILHLLIVTKAITAETVLTLNMTTKAPLHTQNRSGFIDELATEAFRRAKARWVGIRLPAQRGLISSNQGVIDGEIVRVGGMEKLFLNLIPVREKVMNMEFVVFSYKPINLKNGWKDLAGKSIAYINGWKILEENVPKSAEVIKTSNATELFKLLYKKRTDYIIYERWSGRYLLQNLSMKNVYIGKTPLATKEMFIYLHKKHHQLAYRLATTLAEMKKDGSYQQLFKKHLAKYK
ncbi:hypothetical protein MNBD_GAMMA12-676 [hydrothermal vent metagenome]|uniref:Uncharacterized protein n=1 Tax=hydrothermal vent metagenome TaxID=652676 RepID=A0A3B0Z5F2_9ZZZZ